MMETEKLQREVRILKIYVLLSTVLLAGLVFTAAKQITQRTKFEVIDVERINLVEKDGKLRLAIANRDRSPGPIIGGKYMKTREGQRPGMIFFNDKGDECGGMTWESEEKDGSIRANAGLMFDQYNQDQTVGISYSQYNGNSTAGLRIWDRPLTPLAGIVDQLSQIESMEDGPEKTAALKKFREMTVEKGLSGVSRIFVGRDEKNQAVLSIADTKGRPRILLSVDGKDVPSLQFLDENAKVVYRFPAETPSR